MKETKNQIHRVVAVGELIIFAIHGNFPKRLFRAVEALEVGENMQKITFFLFKWVWEMRWENYRTGHGNIFDTHNDLDKSLFFHIGGVKVSKMVENDQNFIFLGVKHWISDR